MFSLVLAALVIVLSIFNGFEKIINRNMQAIDPDLKILPSRGKTFILADSLTNYLTNNEAIKQFCMIIEESALIKRGSRQKPVIIKGVTPAFLTMTRMDTLRYAGDIKLHINERPFVIVGYGIASDLGLNPYSLSPVQIYAGKKGSKQSASLSASLNHLSIHVSGIVFGDPDFSDNYVIAPFDFTKELIGYDKEVSAIEITVVNKEKVKKIQKELYKFLGKGYHVKTRLQLNESIYKMLKAEKFSIFIILIFVLIIAAFNMLASLSMLILDKKSDIQIMKSMGAGSVLIRKIFWLEGWLIIFMGTVSGIFVGTVFCFLQQEYGIIKMQSNNYLTDFYPIDIRFWDIVRIFFIIQVIGSIAAILPVRYITRKYARYINYSL